MDSGWRICNAYPWFSQTLKFLSWTQFQIRSDVKNRFKSHKAHFLFQRRHSPFPSMVEKYIPGWKCEILGGFPGGSVVKNPLASVGDTGSIPDPGRSHMLQNNEAMHCGRGACALSVGATTSEHMCQNYWRPHTLEPVLFNERKHPNKTVPPQLQSSSHSLQLEKNPCSNKDSKPKINKTIYKKGSNTNHNKI